MSYEKILFCSALAVFYEFTITIHNGYIQYTYIIYVYITPNLTPPLADSAGVRPGRLTRGGIPCLPSLPLIYN